MCARAAGVLNSGFLTTLTGLGGRVFGNLLVSLMGDLVGGIHMDDVLMIPLFATWLCTMALVYWFFKAFST